MQGSLGEKIGEGAFSEAYAWAPGQVVKLFKAGVSHLLGRHEVRMIRAVRAAGVPVPEVFGEVTLDGRFGIVLERLEGPTLWHLSRTGAVTFEQAGAIVAALAMSIRRPRGRQRLHTCARRQIRRRLDATGTSATRHDRGRPRLDDCAEHPGHCPKSYNLRLSAAGGFGFTHFGYPKFAR
jgi:hypothetical protein